MRRWVEAVGVPPLRNDAIRDRRRGDERRMFLDLNELADGEILEADICIVGAGAAGITLALELEDGGLDVLLLESGGFEFDPDTQDLYVGENVGLDYHPLDALRLRYLGGTTNHWSGRCWAFAPIDFEIRDWVAGSGWPFGRGHLQPFYVRAQPYVGLGRFGYTLQELGDGRPVLPLGEELDTVVAQYSPPTRFAETYRNRLDVAPTIRVVLHANAAAIRTEGEDGPVKAIEAVSLQGHQVTVRARHFVLAAGGLEVPRLLLQPTESHPRGLGNRYDQLGRHYADHFAIDHAGDLLLHESYPDAEFFSRHDFEDVVMSRFLAPSVDTQRRERLLQCRFELGQQRLDRDSPGMEAVRHLHDELGRGSWPEDFFGHLGQAVRDIDTIVAYVYRGLTNPPPRLFGLRYFGEPEPSADSRITLSDERDALGMRRIRVDWRLTEAARHTYARAIDLLARDVGGPGQGRLHIAVEPEQLFEQMRPSYHPMGATRMVDDPRRGVVDGNARVHGVPNLYIASSSVFPTYSHGSPTLTIVALAIRLADHLKAQGS